MFGVFWLNWCVNGLGECLRFGRSSHNFPEKWRGKGNAVNFLGFALNVLALDVFLLTFIPVLRLARKETL
jgi:hypothetical protein